MCWTSSRGKGLPLQPISSTGRYYSELCGLTLSLPYARNGRVARKVSAIQQAPRCRPPLEPPRQPRRSCCLRRPFRCGTRRAVDKRNVLRYSDAPIKSAPIRIARTHLAQSSRLSTEQTAATQTGIRGTSPAVVCVRNKMSVNQLRKGEVHGCEEAAEVAEGDDQRHAIPGMVVKKSGPKR
jgi:hypothetical protein